MKDLQEEVIEKVTVKKAKSDMWSGLKNYDNCSTKICVGIDKTTGTLKTGLTHEDEEKLEKALGYTQGTLARNSQFWVDYFILIPMEGLTLDLSLPEHRLMYKVLSVKSIVALSLDDLKSKPNAEFVMTNEEQEVKVEINKREYTKKAWALFDEMNTEDMKEVLISLGQAPYSMSNNKIEKVLGDLVEASPRLFLSTISDPLFKDKVFINKLIQKGIVKKRGSAIYFDKELIGANLEAAIGFIKDNANNNVTLAMKQALQGSTK